MKSRNCFILTMNNADHECLNLSSYHLACTRSIVSEICFSIGAKVISFVNYYLVYLFLHCMGHAWVDASFGLTLNQLCTTVKVGFA
jgi:hypothetical protein